MRRQALILTLVALWALCGCGRGGPSGGRVVPVETQDLVLDVEVTGSLASLESEQIGPPPECTDLWQFKIIRMVPEGTQVKVGDEVVVFDSSDLETKLKERENEAKSYAEELGKAHAEGTLAVMSDKLDLQDAQGRKRKSDLSADKPSDVVAGLSRHASEIDRALNQREVEFRIERERAKRQQESSARAVLQARLNRSRGRVAELQAQIAALTVKARRAGTVVYEQNWQGEKRKVGDGIWRGESAVSITSLERMAVRGQVDEVDASHVALRQRARLQLDAHPDKEYVGEVDQVARLVQTESPGSRVRVVELEIKLAATDVLLMRPGMRIHGRIEIARLPGVLQVPLAAVESTAQGPIVTRVTRSGATERVPVKLGRRSREAVEVKAGLSSGDRIFLRTVSETSPGSSGFRLGAS